MMRIYLENLFEGSSGSLLSRFVEHLSFLDFVHESAVTVFVGHHHAGFSRQSVGNDHVAHFLEQQFLCEFHVGLVLFGEEFLDFSLALSIIRHLEISLSYINDELYKCRSTFPSYSLNTLNTYSSMGSSHRRTSYPLRTSPTTRGDFSKTFLSSPLKK